MKYNKLISCFVIMPFSESGNRHTKKYWDIHFEERLKPAIESESIKVWRSDVLRGSIIDKVITDLVTSDIVIADLTDQNPNVFWELGVRLSFKKGTIIIAEEKTELPFDLKQTRVLFYNNLNFKEFLIELKTAVNDVIKNPNINDSFVLKSISGRGSIYEIVNKEENFRKLQGLEKEARINKEFLSKIVKVAESQIESGNLISPTMKFMTSSVELMITTRYLDKGLDFYEKVRNYLNWLNAYNDKILKWDQEVRIGKWFVDKEDVIIDLLSNVQKLFIIEIQHLEKSK